VVSSLVGAAPGAPPTSEDTTARLREAKRRARDR